MLHACDLSPPQPCGCRQPTVSCLKSANVWTKRSEDYLVVPSSCHTGNASSVPLNDITADSLLHTEMLGAAIHRHGGLQTTVVWSNRADSILSLKIVLFLIPRAAGWKRLSKFVTEMTASVRKRRSTQQILRASFPDIIPPSSTLLALRNLRLSR